MKQYIDKVDIIAEIKKRIKEIDEIGTYLSPKGILTNLLCHLNTLEVKEVDLDSERKKYLTEHFNVYKDGILQSKRSNLPLDTYDVIKIAKHFFELGLKAQKKE